MNNRLVFESQLVIGVKDLRISCKIGLLEKEKIEDQELLIDLEVFFDLPETKVTGLDQTLDYCLLKQICENLVKDKHYDLLETYAQDISEKIGELKKVRFLTICIKKPKALMQASCGYVVLRRFFE